MTLPTSSTVTSIVCMTLLGQGAVAAPNPFDGRWSVQLACQDTQDKRGLVKGYDFAFEATIRDGALQGQHGASGQPASVLFTGQVGEDGTLAITASGNTGQSEYSVGKVVRGTGYGYTMQGRLVGSSGQAERIELRRCTATFDKL